MDSNSPNNKYDSLRSQLLDMFKDALFQHADGTWRRRDGTIYQEPKEKPVTE